MEAIEGESETKPEELPPVKPIDKIIVAAAGPLFSFLLAVFFAVIVWVIGRPVPEREGTTTIGEVLPGSPAAVAGLLRGDELVKIDGVPVHRFTGSGNDSVVWRIVRSEGETVKIEYLRKDVLQTAEAKPEIQKTEWWQRRATRSIGIAPAATPVVAKVLPDSPAAAAGFQQNDYIRKVNGQSIYGYSELGEIATATPGQPVSVEVERAGKPVTLSLKLTGAVVEKPMKGSPATLAGVLAGDRFVEVNGKPVYTAEEVSKMVREGEGKPLAVPVQRGKELVKLTLTPQIPVADETEDSPSKPKIPRIGLVWGNNEGIVLDDWGVATIRYITPWEQISTAAGSIFATLDAVFSPKSSIGAQHLGGPLTMMRTYYVLFESPWGWQLALWFSVLLNVNLAIMNLLPFPVLDGGHIVLSTVEAIRGKPLHGRFLNWIQNAFAIALIGFMLFVTAFDVGEFFNGDRTKAFKFSKPAQTEQDK
jgi:regulator of sigma E protease